MQWWLINKHAKYIYFFVLQATVFSLKYVGNVFVSSSFDLASAPIISSHVSSVS